MSRRCSSWVWAFILMLGLSNAACQGDGAKMTELQRVSAGDLDIVLLSAGDALRHGKDAFTIEFRAKSDAHLVDVGEVRATATMPMPGSSPMFGSLEPTRTSVAGRYAVTSDFSMAGTWRLALQWSSPTAGSVTFAGSVQ